MSLTPKVETILGQRGCLVPLIDGFVFHKCGGSQDLYRCKHKSCPVKVRLEMNGNEFQFDCFLSDCRDHFHDKYDIVAIKNTNEKMKELASDPQLRFEPTTKVLRTLKVKDPRRESTIRREFNKMRANALGEMTNHPSFQTMLVFENDKMVVFSNNEKVKQLTHFKTILMDGTFGICPQRFSQVYTIHCLSEKEHFVLFHCLLADKTTETYSNLFQVMNDHLRQFSIDLFDSDHIFMIDYESSVIAALRKMNANIKGCFFHFNQSLYRRIQTTGFINLYQTDHFYHKYAKYLMCLPLLKLEDIEPVFYELLSHVKEMKNEALNQLFDYFERTWIRGNFKIEMWCCNSDIRTNNITESFHSVFSKRFSQFPSSYEYVQRIVEFEEEETKKLNKLKELQETRRKKKYVKRDNDLKVVMRNKERGLIKDNIELLDYLCKVTSNYHYERMFSKDLNLGSNPQLLVNEQENEKNEEISKKKNEEVKPKKKKRNSLMKKCWSQYLKEVK